MEKKIKTAILILIKNSAANTMSATLADFRRYVKRYLGTSRYSETENDGSEDPLNGIVIKGILSNEEKKNLLDYNDNVILLFIEQDNEDEDIIDDLNTITSSSKQQENENN